LISPPPRKILRAKQATRGIDCTEPPEEPHGVTFVARDIFRALPRHHHIEPVVRTRSSDTFKAKACKRLSCSAPGFERLKKIRSVRPRKVQEEKLRPKEKQKKTKKCGDVEHAPARSAGRSPPAVLFRAPRPPSPGRGRRCRRRVTPSSSPAGGGRLARAECCRHTLNGGERGTKEKRLSSEREEHEEEEGVVVYRRRYSALLRKGLLQKKGLLVVLSSIVVSYVGTSGRLRCVEEGVCRGASLCARTLCKLRL
jgi:hypothetical protein